MVRSFDSHSCQLTSPYPHSWYLQHYDLTKSNFHPRFFFSCWPNCSIVTWSREYRRCSRADPDPLGYSWNPCLILPYRRWCRRHFTGPRKIQHRCHVSFTQPRPETFSRPEVSWQPCNDNIMYAFIFNLGFKLSTIAPQITFEWGNNYWKCVDVNSSSYIESLTSLQIWHARNRRESQKSNDIWSYGFELSYFSNERIARRSKKISNMGCLLWRNVSMSVITDTCNGWRFCSFKVTEVALMMDWEDSSGSSGSDDEPDNMWNLHKAVSNLRDTGSGSSRGSMRGLQFALAEGWLIQRARDMCSFAHDRYRQAAQAEADALPEESIRKMSFRVGSYNYVRAY